MMLPEDKSSDLLISTTIEAMFSSPLHFLCLIEWRNYHKILHEAGIRIRSGCQNLFPYYSAYSFIIIQDKIQACGKLRNIIGTGF
ncbi:MAG: hypothetical protein ACLFM1_11715 [Bacteroidales bacterium]